MRKGKPKSPKSAAASASTGGWALFALNPRIILRGLVFIASLVLLGWLLDQTRFGAALDSAWIDTEVRGRGAAGELLFLAVGAGFTAIGLPRQVISFLGGYAFGFAPGGLLALLATVLGCVATFYYARWLGRSFVQHHFATRIRRFDDFLRGHPFTMTLLVRLLPAGSNVATNLAVGVTRAPAGHFFAASALGYIPQTAVFALVGSGISINPGLRIGLAVVLFVISGVLGVWLYRRFRHGKTLGRELERELAEPTSTHRRT